MEDLDPALPTFWAIVERNLDCARRRFLRACGTVMDTGELMLADGIISPEPSDDEQIPAEQDLPLILPRPLDAIRSGAYPRNTVQMEGDISYAQTPKRTGGPLDNSSNKEARATREIEESAPRINLQDFGLPPRGEKTDRLDANRADRQHAIKYRLLGRPNFAHTFGDNGRKRLTREVFNTDPY